MKEDSISNASTSTMENMSTVVTTSIETGALNHEHVDRRLAADYQSTSSDIWSSEKVENSQNDLPMIATPTGSTEVSTWHFLDLSHSIPLKFKAFDGETIHTIAIEECCLACVALSKLKYFDLAVIPDHNDSTSR